MSFLPDPSFEIASAAIAPEVEGASAASPTVEPSSGDAQGDNAGAPKNWAEHMDSVIADLPNLGGPPEESESPAEDASREQRAAQAATREAWFQQAYRQAEEARERSETLANSMRQELDRISTLDEVESFDAWEQFRRDYPVYRAQVAGYEQRAYEQRYQQEMQTYVPHLQGQVKNWAGEALRSVEAQLTGLSDSAKRALGERIHSLLIEEADAGRVFYHRGTRIPGTSLPELNVDFGHVATVIAREVEMARAYAGVEAAARVNAERAARRRGIGAAPPGFSAHVDSSASGRSAGSAGSAGSFADLLAEVLND